MSGEAQLLKQSKAMQDVLAEAKWLGINKVSAYADSLTFLLSAIDWRGQIAQVCEALPHMPSELDQIDLVNTMVNLGYHVSSSPLTLQNFDSRLAPCIFITDKTSHSDAIPLVLLPAPELQGSKVYNPVEETIRPLTDFPNHTGTLYIFSPLTQDLSSQDKISANVDENPFYWFRNISRRFNSIFRQTFLVSFIINILALASSLFVMVVYDKVIGSRSVETLQYLVVGALLAMGMEAILRYLRARSLAYFGVRVDAITSKIIFERLLFLPPRLIEGSSIPSQVARIKDFDSIREFFSGPTGISVLELPFSLIFLFTIAVIGGPLAVVPILLALCYCILAVVMLPRIQASTEKGAISSVKKQALLVETMQKSRAIKAHGLGDAWLKRFKILSGEAAISSFSSAFLTSLIEAFAYGLSIAAGVTTLTTGIWLAWQGNITTGGLIASMMLVWRVLTPLQAICNSLVRIRYIFRSINQVHKLIKTPPEGKISTVDIHPVQLKGEVSFNGVGLRYTSERSPIFSGLTFDIHSGEAIAIAGSSGSGKTSLLKLINGLYVPQVGSILIDGLDIRQRDPLQLRKNISYVPQVVELFHGSLEKNLRMVKPDASDQELLDALEWAGALKDVQSMPDGLNTYIGDYRSEQLSSILTFQLSIARGYLRDAPIMLFDEFPSAVLHETTGENFRKYVTSKHREKTILYVTDRTSDVLLADKLIYLPGNGQVLAGEPEELLQALQD